MWDPMASPRSDRAAAVDQRGDAPSVDVHSHLGRFFMSGAADVTTLAASFAPPFSDRALEQARAGGLTAVMAAGVADHVLLESEGGRLHAARDYASGEAYAEYQRQLQVFRALMQSHRLRLALGADDIVAAFREQRLTCLYSYEGADFIEDRLERIADAHRHGLRSVTLMHYRTNQVGDSQTESPVHNGLSRTGKDIVKAMNASGILVDLSHASLAATRDAVAVASRPAIISHSNLRQPGLDHPRLLTLEHARLVTTAGGVVGCVPAGWGQSEFNDYIETIMRMVDALGVAHIAIGTDMDYTYRPVIRGYDEWPRILTALRGRGMSESELVAVKGGNFLRLLREVSVRAPA